MTIRKTNKRRLPLILAVVALLIVAAAVAEFTVFPVYLYVDKVGAREHLTLILIDFLDTHSGFLTAIATLAIAFFILSLKDATDRLWDEATIQRQETQRAADAAEIQSQWAGQQVEIARQQKELLRIEYYATHRPRLVVKDVYFDNDNGLSFELANVGGSRCVITKGWAALGHVDDERWFKEREHAGLVIEGLEGRTFDAGELKRFTLSGAKEEINGQVLSPLSFLERNSSNLYFFGAFHYIDERGSEFGIERLGVFRRRWIPDNTRFRRTNGEDHEYFD